MRGVAGRAFGAVALGVAAIALTGCGHSSSTPKSVAESQVVASIGNQDYTVAEYEFDLRHSRLDPATAKPEEKRSVIASALARKDLVERALEDKMDREPEMYLELQRVREDTLGRRVMGRDRARRAEGVNTAEIDSFILKHPEVFMDHEVFTLDEVSFQKPADMTPITPEVEKLANVDAIRAVLTKHAVKTLRSEANVDSLLAPQGLVALLKKHKTDEVFFFDGPKGSYYFKVLKEEAAPLDPEVSRKVARAILLRQSDGKADQVVVGSALQSAKFKGVYTDLMAPLVKAAADQAKKDGSALEPSAIETPAAVDTEGALKGSAEPGAQEEAPAAAKDKAAPKS